MSSPANNRRSRRAVRWCAAATLVLAGSWAAVAIAWPGEPGAPGERAAAARPAPLPLPLPARDCDRRLQSAAFLVADARGRTLAALHPDRRRAVASITKLMTARLVLREGGLGRRVSVPRLRLAADESRAGLRPGQRIPRGTLLRLLLVPSANDAAETLAAARPGGRAGFVHGMNRAARRLGLSRTSYRNPSGMSAPDQLSTARDSVRLARVLMADRRVRRIARLRAARVPGGRRLRATNSLLGRVRGLDGLKTGHLDGDWSMVASATGRGGRVFVASLGAPTEEARDRDAHCLLTVGRRLVAP